MQFCSNPNKHKRSLELNNDAWGKKIQYLFEYFILAVKWKKWKYNQLSKFMKIYSHLTMGVVFVQHDSQNVMFDIPCIYKGHPPPPKKKKKEKKEKGFEHLLIIALLISSNIGMCASLDFVWERSSYPPKL